MPGRKAGEKQGYQYDACDGQDKGIPTVGGDENVKGFCYIIIGVIKKRTRIPASPFPDTNSLSKQTICSYDDSCASVFYACA